MRADLTALIAQWREREDDELRDVAARVAYSICADELAAVLARSGAMPGKLNQLIAQVVAQPKQVLTGQEGRAWAERLAADAMAHDEIYGTNYEKGAGGGETREGYSVELVRCMNEGRWQEATMLLVQKVDSFYRDRPAAQGWQPIETAPKGRPSIMTTALGGMLVGDWADYCRYNIPEFTHWMWPDPPAVSGVTRGEK